MRIRQSSALPLSAQHWRYCLLILAVLLVPLYIWLAGLGYGTNIDSYAILRSWQRMADSGWYRPSRGQGYPLPELAIGFLASLGGSQASNALSVILALASLGLGYDLLRRSEAPGALPATVFVMANPHWMIAGTTSLDYIYGVFFLVLGLWMLVRGWLVTAMLALACATGSRIIYGPLGLATLAWAAVQASPRERPRYLEALAGFCVISGLFYIPALISARVTLGFLHHSEPANNFLLARIGRFVWKTPALYGNIGALLLLLGLGPRLWRQRCYGIAWRHLPMPRRVTINAGLAMLGYSTALYFYLPAEISYQLPSLLAMAALLAAVELPLPWQAGLIASQILLGLVQPDLLTPETEPHGCMAPITTTGVHFDPDLKPGVLVAHIRDSAEAACALSRLPHPPTDPWVALPSPRPGPPAILHRATADRPPSAN